MKSIVLGGGCFWCVEAAFEKVKGIKHTEVAYSGGKENPSYESVCEGDGNIEVVKLMYEDITLIEILDIFFKIHDPTSQDKQGNDIGLQYRSVIFYKNDEDKSIIEKFIQEKQKDFTQKILTQVSKLKNYFKAESYHQHYFANNPEKAYCQAVIKPKLAKLNLL